MDPESLSALLGTWGYFALLALLVLTGFGSPIPEDLLLLTAGYLVFAGAFEWSWALGVCSIGVVAGDVVLYFAGRHLAWHSRRPRFSRFLTPARLRRGTSWFDRWGDSLVLAARLVPGTRAIVFVAAGVRAMPLGTFLRYDVLGTLAWVPAMLTTGSVAGARLGSAAAAADWLAATSLVVAAAWVLVLAWLTLGRGKSET